MVLYVIGLGLGDEKDITVRGLEAVRGSAKVVLEHYTSVLGVDKAKLVRFGVISKSFTAAQHLSFAGASSRLPHCQDVWPHRSLLVIRVYVAVHGGVVMRKLDRVSRFGYSNIWLLRKDSVIM